MFNPSLIHVHPIISPRSGEAVRNQYSITGPGFVAFQSYDSLIAVYDVMKGRLILGRDYDYSVTTSKYLHEWLREHFPQWRDVREACQGKSLKDTLSRAISAGRVDYDFNMR